MVLYPPRRAQTLIFFFEIRTVKRNRNEIEAEKIRFWAPNEEKEKERKKKLKENERK